MSATQSVSVGNAVIEAVMDMIDSGGYFASIHRGALDNGPDICCETAYSTAESVFLTKDTVELIDLTINAKHSNLKTLSDTLNDISDRLTRAKTYTSGNGFEIIDIMHGSPSIPSVIGREDNNDWLMAIGVIIKYYRKD